LGQNGFIEEKEVEIYKKDPVSGKLVSAGKQKIHKRTVSRDCSRLADSKNLLRDSLGQVSRLSKSPGKVLLKKTHHKPRRTDLGSPVNIKRQAKSISHLR
jgi:hypothetical protein